MTATLPHKIRAGRESDRAFITKGWASEMRTSGFAQHVPNEVYWPAQHALIARLLERSSVLVAHDPEDEGHVYGCVVVEGELSNVVHWLYVKGAFRRMGVARSLVDCLAYRSPIVCTQAPRIFNDRFWVAKMGLIYDPYLLSGISLDERAPRNMRDAGKRHYIPQVQEQHVAAEQAGTTDHG